MEFLKQRGRLFTPAYVLLLFLLFWLPIESTLIGRAYTHVVGLNGAGALRVTMNSETIVIAVRAAFLMTIQVPFLIVLFSRRTWHNRTPSMLLVRIGLCVWLAGATLSTLVHIDNALVLLNYVAGMGSAGAVFFACKRVNMTGSRHFELAYVAIAAGGLIPMLYDLHRYYAQFGIPTLAKAIAVKYDIPFWSTKCYFGNPDNASNVYGLFAAISLAIVATKLFSRPVRWLAVLTLAAASASTVLTMARTGIVILAFGFLVTMLFIRSLKGLTIGIVAALLLLMSGQTAAKIYSYFLPVLKYDVEQERTAAGRIESMQQGWAGFVDHPAFGLGPGQSPLVVTYGEAHQLAIWQATDNGILGLAGVLLVTAGCIWRLASLLLTGAVNNALRLEYVFLLAPALYFVRGLVSDVTINVTVINTWICLTFAALAIADRTFVAAPTRWRVLLHPQVRHAGIHA
jgi:hypothetical protein